MHAVRIYSQDIGMEFGIEKFALLEMKSSKRPLTGRMELPNKEKIKTLEETETKDTLRLTQSNKWRWKKN